MSLNRPEPRYFGPDERRNFGWLHRPANGDAPSAVGVVFCNPLGYEVECAHRAIRHFAAAAAAIGFPVLRFDYDGTGDSAGSDLDSKRWEAWLTSTDLAVEELRRSTGVTQVCLIGVRLGAAIAVECAIRRSDVAGLVAIAPVVTGKAWLREVKALQGASRFATPTDVSAFHREPLGSVGVAIAEETQASLRQVDIVTHDRLPARDVLILDREDRPPNTKWVEQLTRHGARVIHRAVPGFVEMLLDPHESIVPAQAERELTKWLATTFKCVPGVLPTEACDTPVTSAKVTTSVCERAVYLDQERRLFAIVSARADDVPPTRAVILLNSGAIHHVGHGRMHVNFARQWAARGLLVIRCDISGIGDSLSSPGRTENDVYTPDAARDVGVVVSYLRNTWGVTSVDAMGVCSGGYHALKAAVAGVELTGIVVVNPLTFFWKPGMSLALPDFQVSQAAEQYKQSVFRLDKWRKLLLGKVNVAAFARVALQRVTNVAASWLRNSARLVKLPLRDDLGAELDLVAKRGIPIRFVFAHGEPGEDLLRMGAGSTFRRLLRRGAMSVHHIQGPDHSFSAAWMQTSLMKLLDEIREP